VNILSIRSSDPHSILDELAMARIPVFGRRGALNNKRILRSIALNGSLLKYDVCKSLELPLSQYGTISRRMDALKEGGYLGEAGSRATKRGKQEDQSMYGLTWRGFIASITMNEVRENILQVLRVNPLLDFPEKETVLSIFEELITNQELETIARSVLEAFLKTIPNLEFVENEPMSILAWVLSIQEEIKLPKGFKLSRIPKDAWELLDRPAILEVVKEKIVPLVKQKATEMEVMYHFFSALSEAGDFISGLEVEDQPSKKVKEFVETELSPRLSKLSENSSED